MSLKITYKDGKTETLSDCIGYSIGDEGYFVVFEHENDDETYDIWISRDLIARIE